MEIHTGKLRSARLAPRSWLRSLPSHPSHAWISRNSRSPISGPAWQLSHRDACERTPSRQTSRRLHAPTCPNTAACPLPACLADPKGGRRACTAYSRSADSALPTPSCIHPEACKQGRVAQPRLPAASRWHPHFQVALLPFLTEPEVPPSLSPESRCERPHPRTGDTSPQALREASRGIRSLHSA